MIFRAGVLRLLWLMGWSPQQGGSQAELQVRGWGWGQPHWSWVCWATDGTQAQQPSGLGAAVDRSQILAPGRLGREEALGGQGCLVRGEQLLGGPFWATACGRPVASACTGRLDLPPPGVSHIESRSCQTPRRVK